jgi:HEAT repeat protein
MSPQECLHRIFAADRALREAESELLDTRSQPALEQTLWDATEEALGLDDRDEAGMRLERLADLCAQVAGPRMTDALLRILGDDSPQVRHAAGEALLDLAYERYADVARAIERALEAGMSATAAAELPYMLAEVGEPSALPLIRGFLDHGDADVVASAIEALAQLGDPDAAADLQRFVDDTRPVTMEDLDEETSTTIGELARDALKLIGAAAVVRD